MMKNILSLSIGKFELDWQKFSNNNNYSKIFSQYKLHENVNYYYSDNFVVKNINKIGALQSLKEIKSRLNILGYSLKECKKKYDNSMSRIVFDDKKGKSFYHLNFSDFSKYILSLDIECIDNISSFFNTELSDKKLSVFECFKNSIMLDPELSGKLNNICKGNIESVIYSFYYIDPLIIVRLLAENENNLQMDITWYYSDLIDNKVLKISDIKSPIKDEDKILLLTEGTTDINVLRKIIDFSFKYIADLFIFADTSGKEWAFSSCTELVKLCKGLYKIGRANKTIAIFDNDAAGVEAFERIPNSYINGDFLVILLPELNVFKKIKTIGPSGTNVEDINGCGVSIECFLDFNSVKEEPVIRWRSYIDKVHRYQGVIEPKDELTKIFLKTNLEVDKYDTSKLLKLVEYILKSWEDRTL